MIRTPPRAVTRFLIPFIDVLILLLCVFLLTPFMGQTAREPGNEHVGENLDDHDAILARLRETAAKLHTLERLQKKPFAGLRIVVLEIDAGDGALYAENSIGGRQQLASQADAARFINLCKRASGAAPVGFLIRYPRELSGFPLLEQIQVYERWFRDEKFAVQAGGF